MVDSLSTLVVLNWAEGRGGLRAMLSVGETGQHLQTCLTDRTGESYLCPHSPHNKELININSAQVEKPLDSAKGKENSLNFLRFKLQADPLV